MKRVSAESAIALISPPAPIRTVNPNQPGGDDIAADQQEIHQCTQIGLVRQRPGYRMTSTAQSRLSDRLSCRISKGDSKPSMDSFRGARTSRSRIRLALRAADQRKSTRRQQQAAAQLSDGSIRGFEEVSRYSTPDLGYVVQIERAQARLAGGGDMSPIALRATMIFRREGDTWRIVHRHADPITTPRPISTVVETQEHAAGQ